jgi:hypothetical protein
MMNRKLLLILPLLVGQGVLAAPVQIPVEVNFGSIDAGTLTLLATPLAPEAFFGKNLVIPVTISSPGPINPKNLRIEIHYQLLDSLGAALTPEIAVPIQAQKTAKPNVLLGSAFIPRSELMPIRHGGRIAYFFRAQRGSRDSVLSAAGQGGSLETARNNPFLTSVVNERCQAVGPAGSPVSVQDLFQSDGRTGVNFVPGALSSMGQLCIRQEDTVGWPAGPGGTQPAVVYTIDLLQTSLVQPTELTLSYSADLDGKVTDLKVPGTDLTIQWLASGVWRPTSRSTVDTTLHTVKSLTSHFSTFALFPTGPLDSAGVRPPERIITPNGDGINDTVAFPTLGFQDEVRIFDVRGRRVRTIRSPLFIWDGRDDDGAIVESGVYIYQYTLAGDRVSGVIAVAK